MSRSRRTYAANNDRIHAFMSRLVIAALAGGLAAYHLVPSVSAQPQPDEPPTDAGVDAPAAPVVAAPAPEPTKPAPAPSTPPEPRLSKADLELLHQAETAAAEIIESDDEAPAESASSVHLDQRDLQFRSRTQVSDILRQVPGLMVSQHAGGGKSDQYFIRGFDADHGTDIAIFADGIPVNMPSHGHGQGYADTHFLIPETINSVDVHKGPYSARFGDFYTAGAMELSTIDEIAGPTLWVSGGAPLAGPHAVKQYNRRIVGMASPEIRESDKSIIALEIGDTDGPFDNKQNFRQGNALLKWQGKVGRGELKIESNWYEAKWNASGQVPESAVASGLISRFGSLDPSEGGDTSRTSAQIGYTVHDDRGGEWAASAFVLSYRMRLYSDFTLYAKDPIHGDEIEQTDARTTYGLDAHYQRRLDLGDMDSIVRLGAQMRNDDVENALWHDEKRARLADCFGKPANPCNDSMDRIRDTAVYAEANIHLIPHVHVLPGIRFEQLVWDVEDLDPSTRNDPSATTGGTAGKALVLPKLSVEAEVTDKLDVFANGGSGFHSNDARSNVASSGNGALARALGAEIGVRTSLVPHARFSVDLWYLHLDSELVWSGDEGGTSPGDPTRRYGVDLEGAWNPVPWLRFDANVSLAHSTFVHNAGNGNALALAPKIMGQGGVSYVHDDLFVSLRGRGIGDRPGNDDNTLTAKGYLIFDLMAGYKPTKKLDLNLTINNVLNSAWREAQFADSSAVTPTAPVVEQMHFTPGIPLTATVTAAYQF